MNILKPVTRDQWQVTGTESRSADLVTRHPSPVTRHSPLVTRHSSLATCHGFTMIEIAICLAIIGIALVAIVGVLPLGMSVQRENREGTIINQDATVFIEAIRNGARGMNDLTNYVYFITNNWALYNPDGTVKSSGGNGYTGYPNPSTTIAPGYVTPPGTFTAPATTISSGTNIVGLLTTPEFTDGLSGAPIPSLNFGGYSNHIVAYVRSLSGPAVEKPPQDNQILQADTFSYRIFCVNAPVATDTNLFYLHPFWQPQPNNAGDLVFYNGSYWQAAINTLAGDVPGQSSRWAKSPLYALELAANLHELRLTFLWPQQPNGKLGNGHQTYRTLVAGQIATNAIFGPMLYFYQPQSFAITK
jgi:prepilin-type N-terminal cleavage/methylation domain-containing protein